MEWLSFAQTPYFQQIAVLCILVAALFLFIKNTIRYDGISLILMLIIIGLGVLSFEEVFANFGHPVIIVVACMFVMGEALVRSGVIDALMGKMGFFYTRPILGLAVLVFCVAVISSFVNNAGALAIVVPIAVHLARKSNTPIALYLLPLAFASHLGGFTTLIGTPRNILISDFRAEATGTGFQMFDFLPVGGMIALLGIIFLITVSWRFIPIRKTTQTSTPTVRTFITEVSIREDTKVRGMNVSDFQTSCKNALSVQAIYREGQSIPLGRTVFALEDKLILEGTVESLTYWTEHFHLSLTGIRALEHFVTNEDEQTTIEALVPPYSRIVGQSWDDVQFRDRFGVNFIGVAHMGNPVRAELSAMPLWPNDIMLLRGRPDSIAETVRFLQLLPLADEEITLGRNLRIPSVILILVSAIALASLNILPLAVVFLATTLILILFNFVSLKQAYGSIDQTVLILLAGMITLGDALQRSGAAETVAKAALMFGEHLGPVIMLGVVLVFTIALSDFINTTASAVTMAPIAILIAQSLGVSIDPFLIAVAIGASCAFLTPIGHESNAMVMRRGGYTFKDYFRTGLPLEILIVCTSLPLILHFWPL